MIGLCYLLTIKLKLFFFPLSFYCINGVLPKKIKHKFSKDNSSSTFYYKHFSRNSFCQFLNVQFKIQIVFFLFICFFLLLSFFFLIEITVEGNIGNVTAAIL